MSPAHALPSLSETTPLVPSKERDSQSSDGQPEHSQSAFHGAVWMALAALGFSCMTTAIRVATSRFGYSPYAAVLFRSFVHLILSTIVLKSIVHVTPLDLTPSQRCWLAVRGLFGTLAMTLVFCSLAYVPAGEATAIFAFSPILTMILSKLVLRETASIWDIVCAILGVFGIWLIADPNTSGDQHVAGAIFILIGACFAAMAYVSVRRMGTDVHFMLSVFALGAVGIPVVALFGGKEAFQHVLSNHRGTGIVLLGSLAAFFAQSCLNKGLQSCKAGQAVVVKNLEVPSAYMLGILLLDERPTMARFLGSIVVVAAVVLIGVQRPSSR
ncbi:EamA-like transporter [Gracilaria domingensis]|nr:EamA-like transporter [Gracilaria domingensis]